MIDSRTFISSVTPRYGLELSYIVNLPYEIAVNDMIVKVRPVRPSVILNAKNGSLAVVDMDATRYIRQTRNAAFLGVNDDLYSYDLDFVIYPQLVEV